MWQSLSAASATIHKNYILKAFRGLVRRETRCTRIEYGPGPPNLKVIIACRCAADACAQPRLGIVNSSVVMQGKRSSRWRGANTTAWSTP